MTADSEIFSTPPTTPGPSKIMEIQPSISRRNSRPISLHIDQNAADWTSDVVLEENSPEFKKATQHLIPPTGTNDEATVPEKAAHLKAMASPCFVHSQLDKNLSLSGWLLEKQNQTIGDVGVSKSLRRNDRQSQPEVKLNRQASISPPASSSSSAMSNYEDDDDYAGSLTKQLAETAVGVREMSKQLGRARVRSNIQNVLIITKARDNRLIKLTREIALYLMLKPRNGHPRGLVVYVDNQLRHSRRFDAEGIERDHPELFVPFPRRRTSSSNSLCSMSSSSGHNGDFYLKDDGQLRYWTSDMCSNSPHLFDFVVTLGGDGTVLFTSWLFQKIVPPVLPFALGSLGFLTNFDFADHQAVMDSAIDSGIRVNLRMRFTCTVYRAVPQEKGKGRKAVKNGETGEIMMKNIEKGGWEALEGGWNGGFSMIDGGRCKDKEIMCFTTRPAETFEVLNDLVVDRGPSPYVSLLELFGDEHHMTTVQADGLTVSTPTGSTAYSLSAGGSLVHPEIPALLITPICPHTLSFRPMLLPDSMELRICVPFNSRSTAWASFDGRGRVELKQGDHIKVTASKYPFPTVCADKQSTDWFHAISRTLKWNERERQKSFVVVEEGPSKVKKRSKRGRTVSDQPVKAPSPEPVDETLEDEEEDEVSDEEDEEDKFDIDDSSPEAAQAKAINNARNRQTEDNEKFTRTSRERRATPTLEGGTFARATKSRSRSRTSGIRSGIDSPGRFAGPQPHHPHISSRHVGGMQSPEFSSSSTSSLRDSQEGTRDDIYSSPKAVLSNRSRIPKDREAEMDSIKTPTAGDLVNGRRGHYRVASSEHHPHRAFAVWGHDESDSNASDSDA